MKETVGFHIPKMQAELHRLIKISAAKTGKSMIDWVVEAIKDKAAKEKEKENV